MLWAHESSRRYRDSCYWPRRRGPSGAFKGRTVGRGAQRISPHLAMARGYRFRSRPSPCPLAAAWPTKRPRVHIPPRAGSVPEGRDSLNAAPWDACAHVLGSAALPGAPSSRRGANRSSIHWLGEGARKLGTVAGSVSLGPPAPGGPGTRTPRRRPPGDAGRGSPFLLQGGRALYGGGPSSASEGKTGELASVFGATRATRRTAGGGRCAGRAGGSQQHLAGAARGAWRPSAAALYGSVSCSAVLGDERRPGTVHVG